MSSTVLILGARGRFGLAAARAFADAGWRVLAQMRPGTRPPAEAAGDARIEWLAANLQDSTALAGAAAGASVLVHAVNPAYTHRAWKAQALPLLEATIQIARLLGATVMLPGNVYNFGVDMPAVLNEDTPQEARTVKGQIRIGMEEHLRRSGVRGVVIRAGDFFGSGRGSWLDLVLAKDLRRGVLTYPGPQDVGTAWAYLPDLARTFVAVAARRGQLRPFERLHFRGHQATGQQWLDAITPLAREQGWLQPEAALKLRHLPWPLMRVGAWLLPTWAALVEMRYLWDTPHTLDNTRLQALIGDEPHTPWPVAVRTALADLGLLAHRAGVTSGMGVSRAAG
ncbi:sugar nucleotide-binding protein [Rhodoferax sp.]|uniref:NmrA family NAD(P)-binding protein n=1 Tax=Rhodoferax sp. TaxID=50421 RepID=UPI002633CEEC|nr:sugar nucleotide-binding protein [Rhodoferax sp.]MDD2926643.1 sugar nucleotide-binding protein [Rhodoferax sp.]